MTQLFDISKAVADANADYFHDNQAALDRIQLKRLQADLETMMLRHGRGRIIGIAVEAIREAERRGAKW